MVEEGGCMVNIDITAHTSTISSWYEIWERVTAIACSCTRSKGKGGKARGLGEYPATLGVPKAGC